MHTMAKLWKNYVGNTSAISLMSILHTAFNHAVNINIWDPKINPSPLEKRSTVILLALSPMVQQIKKEIAEELDFVTGLGNIDSKDPFSYDIAKRQDETPFDHGISFCNVCKGELINMYFLCQGCETEHTSNFIVGRCCFKITTATVCDGAKLHMPEKESHQTFKVKFRLFRSLDVDNGDKALTMFQEIEKATDFVVARRSAALKHSLVPRNDTNEASISATNLNSPTCAVAATRTSTNESKDGNELTAERRDTPIDSVRDGEASVIDSVNTDTDMDSPPLANQAGKPPASAATRCVVASPPFSNVPAPNDDYVKSLEAAEAFRNRECHCHCGRDDIFYSADLGGLRQHLPGDRFRVICELRRQDPCKAYIAFVEEALAYLPDWTRPNHATK